MKLTNCLRILLAVVFVLGVLISSHAGQAGVVVSPGAGGPTVKKGVSKVTPKKVVPKKEEKKVVPVPIKKNDQRIPSIAPQITRDKPKVTMPAPKPMQAKPNIIVQSFSYKRPQGRKLGEPFKEGEGATLSIIFKNKGNAKSGKNHKYTISCSVKGGGPGCPVQNQTRSIGKEIAPNNTYPVLLPAALKKVGEYKVTVKVAGARIFTQKTVKLKVVPAPKKKNDQSKPSVTPQITRDKSKATTGQPHKPKTVVPVPRKKMDLEKQAPKSTIPATTPSPKGGVVSPGAGDSKTKKKATAPTMKFKTHLSVKLPSLKGNQWGTEYNETEWMVLKFRWWAPKDEAPVYGKWQVSKSPAFNTILADGDAGRAPEMGQYQFFYIDFKNITKQYTFQDKVHVTKQDDFPDKVHVTKQGASGGKVHVTQKGTFPDRLYVRVVPRTESEPFTPSPTVKVSIVGGADFHFKDIGDIKVDVLPYGTYVKFFVTTTNNGFITLRLHKSPPPIGRGCDPTLAAAAVLNHVAVQGGTEEKIVATGLKPGRSYTWEVCPDDLSGDRETGIVKTLRRRATVTIQKVDIIDDSDRVGAGGCIFSFFINPDAGIWGEKNAWFPWNLGEEVTCDSGETITFDPGVAVTLVDVRHDTLEFNATGLDNDGGVTTSCPEPGPMAPIEGSIQNVCVDASGETLTFNLEPPGPQNEIIYKTFQIQTLGGPAGLDLRFHGFLSVDYIK